MTTVVLRSALLTVMSAQMTLVSAKKDKNSLWNKRLNMG